MLSYSHLPKHLFTVSQLLRFCKAKYTVNKSKRPLTDWEKDFTNPKSDRGLISNIYKELKKLDSRKPNNPIKNGVQSYTKNSQLRNTEWLRSTWKKCSTSLIIRKMQIKTTLGFHLTPVRMAKIKISGDSRCWRGCGERGTLLHFWWDSSFYNHSRNQSGGSSENWT